MQEARAAFDEALVMPLLDEPTTPEDRDLADVLDVLGVGRGR